MILEIDKKSELIYNSIWTLKSSWTSYFQCMKNLFFNPGGSYSHMILYQWDPYLTQPNLKMMPMP